MFVVVIAIAVTAGYLSGGRLRGIATLRLRSLWLIWLPMIMAFAASLAWIKDSAALGRAVSLQTNAAIGAFLIVNSLRQRAGMQIALGLMAIGWLLNWAVLVANGGMPVPHDLLKAREPAGALFKLAGMHLQPHVPISPSTQLPWLGDVLHVRMTHVIIPFSVGDAILALGTILLIVLAMRVGSSRPALKSTDDDRPLGCDGRTASKRAQVPDL